MDKQPDHAHAAPWPQAAGISERLGFAIRSAAVAVRSGFVWLIPLLMVSSLVMFVSLVLQFANLASGLAEDLQRVGDAINMILPYAIAAAMGAMFAIQWHLPRPAVAMLAIGHVAMIMSLYGDNGSLAQAIAYFSSVLVPLLLVPMLASLVRCRVMHLTESDAAGANIMASLNLVLPALVATLFMLSLALATRALWPVDMINTWLAMAAHTPGGGAVVYALLNSALWSVGLHGYHVLMPMLDALDSAAGSGEGVRSFLGAFVFIGGSGSTLSLALALLLFSRSATHRMLAVSSLPIALFNINELLLFGLPIVFNPRLLVPFMLVPALNAAIGQIVIGAGLIQIAQVSLPFNSPVLFNAWIAADGHWSGLALQLVLVAMGTVIYFPFVRAYESHRRESELVFRWLDTSMRQRSEEASTLLDDPIGMHIRRVQQENQLLAQLRSLSDHEFFLQYQPQVRSTNNDIIGCEALIRARDDGGAQILPGAFLEAFERAGLSREIDLWVLENVLRQTQAWTRAGHPVTVSVNISAESLVDSDTVDRMQALIGDAGNAIHIEVTERTLATDSRHMAMALERLRDAGARVLIDDFGTEYSSLSYLHRYAIDGVKIDRSFVIALSQPRGQQVFGAILSLTEQLGLQVIVEGVETAAQLAFVPRDERVSVQGWYYSKAIDPIEMLGFVAPGLSPRCAPKQYREAACAAH